MATALCHYTIDFKITHHIKDYMTKNYIFDERPFVYDAKTNEIRFEHYEKMIDQNPDEYYNAERMAGFWERRTTHYTFPPVIFDKQKLLLNEINKIFQKHNTHVKIIINPLYDQRELNKKDLEVLIDIFGRDVVFDFSGKNDLTAPVQNYYEQSHYRPHVADSVMARIYRRDAMINP